MSLPRSGIVSCKSKLLPSTTYMLSAVILSSVFFSRPSSPSLDEEQVRVVRMCIHSTLASTVTKTEHTKTAKAYFYSSTSCIYNSNGVGCTMYVYACALYGACSCRCVP